MLRDFRSANFDELAELWNRQCPDKYRIDAALLKLNTVDCPVFDWGASLIEYEDDAACGFVSVKHSAARLYAGPDRDAAHLSAIVFADCNRGVDLLKHTKRLLRNRGTQKLVFGQDSCHFFPGCPSECGTLRDFLTIEGFEPDGDQVDLTRDIAGYEPPAGVSLLPAEGATTGRLINENDLPELRRFFAQTFTGRWQYDVLHKIEAEGRCDFVFGLFLGNRIEGFALLQDATHNFPISGAVWRGSLGENWCTLGPIGVSEAVRGQGLGDALLASALTHMKAGGKRMCLIDWTTLKDWYGKHGFVATNQYRSFALNLGF